MTRAIGFVIFALATQFLAWVSRVDLLEDFNIFAIPRTMLLLGGSIVAWIVIDAVAGSMRSETRRQIVFWTFCALLGIAAAVVPPLLSRDGLAIGILHFFFGMWVITIAAYGAIAWIAEAFWRKRKAKRRRLSALTHLTLNADVHQRDKMKMLAAIALLASTLSCFGGEASRPVMLTDTVTAVNQSLQSHDYTNTVRHLFHLTNGTEIAVAAVHLQRPKCLAMYEKLFAQLVSTKPSLDGDPPRAASFRCPDPVVVGTNALDRYEKMEVMFVFDGSQWIFHDPSFERRLGRRITSKE